MGRTVAAKFEVRARPRLIDSALAAQRAYVRQSAARSQFGLMVPEAFVRGIRDLGYRSNGDAIAELIDNSIQAYADRVDVAFGYDGSPSTKKPSQLAVVDNGHGMEPDMSRMAVMWGGTHREDDRGGLGRYGYGLPCSAVSLGRRFSVISKVSGGSLYSVTLDLDAIAAGEYANDRGEIIVPEPEKAALPTWLAERVEKSFPRAGGRGRSSWSTNWTAWSGRPARDFEKISVVDWASPITNSAARLRSSSTGPLSSL